MAQESLGSQIVGRLKKLVSPDYDLAGKDLRAEKRDAGADEAVRKYMEAADANESKMLAGRKKLSDRNLGQGKKAAKKKAMTRKRASKRG